MCNLVGWVTVVLNPRPKVQTKVENAIATDDSTVRPNMNPRKGVSTGEIDVVRDDF